MQLLLPIEGESLTLEAVHTRLVARFGMPGPWRLLDPVGQFVMGMIGGRTREAESRDAYMALRRQFGNWEAVRDAPSRKVQAAMAPVNFSEIKAPRLQNALKAITAKRRKIELDFLGDLAVETALAWLERLPGVGRKVSAATLNFSTLRMRALVVDTHHLRVVRKLGLTRPHASHEEAYRRLMPRLPPDWDSGDLDDHHHLLKRLGQTICRSDESRCRICPLQGLCPAARVDGIAFELSH